MNSSNFKTSTTVFAVDQSKCMLSGIPHHWVLDNDMLDHVEFQS